MADVNECPQERRETIAAGVQPQALEFDAALDAIANGVFIYDAEGLLVRANRVAIQAYGVEPGRMHWWDKLRILNIFHPDGRPVAREELPIGRALCGETVRNVPLTLTTRAGERRSVFATATPLYREQQLIGGVAVWNDVTEQERAMDALRRDEELLEYAHVLMRDAEGRIVFWNKGAEKLYGWTKDEALGQISHFLLRTQLPIPLEAILTQLLAEGTWEGELVHTKRDGTRVTVASHWVLQRDSSGNPIRILEVNNDTTARRQAEEDLRAARDELEHRVQARTAELWDANEALRVSGAYNRSLIEASLDPLVTIGPDGKIKDVNAATERATGCERQDLIGTDFSDYFTEPERARAGYRQVFRDGLVRDYALELRHRDGHLTPVLYNASVYRGEDGQVIGVFAAARDVTERKRAESEREAAHEALRAASAYNRSLIEASLDPLVTIGPDGKITDVNAATERATGYERQDLIGTDFSDYFTEPERARAGYRQVFRDGLVRDYALELRHRDGHLTPVLYNASVYRDEGGQVVGVFAAARDITERKRAESERAAAHEALRAASAYNRSLIEASLDPLVTIGPDGKITDVNAATERATGYERQKLVGTDFSDYFTEPERARAGYQQVFRDGLVRDYALDLRHRDGHLTPVLYNASVYRGEDGQVIGVFAAARDVTERKRAEEEIRKLNEELEERVRERTAELEAFAYSVSHDLRAPLRAIDGYTKMLLEDCLPTLDAESRRKFNAIRLNAVKMGQLVDGLLAFSRLGRAGISTRPIDMMGLAQEAWTEQRQAWPNDRIDFALGPLPRAYGDYSLVRQVLANLLSNAVKFSRPKGEIRIELGGRVENQETIYYVRDHGVGFDMQYAGKLFGVFQRLHSEQEFEGTGIGLALVQRIVHRHGGRVWAEAKEGEGATFYFTLPCQPQAYGSDSTSTGT